MSFTSVIDCPSLPSKNQGFGFVVKIVFLWRRSCLCRHVLMRNTSFAPCTNHSKVWYDMILIWYDIDMILIFLLCLSFFLICALCILVMILITLYICSLSLYQYVPICYSSIEVMVYNDMDVYHSAPDRIHRESVWRFMWCICVMHLSEDVFRGRMMIWMCVHMCIMVVFHVPF